MNQTKELQNTDIAIRISLEGKDRFMIMQTIYLHSHTIKSKQTRILKI